MVVVHAALCWFFSCGIGYIHCLEPKFGWALQQGRSYGYFDTLLNYADATDICEEKNGTLLILSDDELANNILGHKLLEPEETTAKIWIGIDTATKVWQWVDGTFLLVDLFDQKSKPPVDGSKLCGMNIFGDLTGSDCSVLAGFICEIGPLPCSSNPCIRGVCSSSDLVQNNDDKDFICTCPALFKGVTCAEAFKPCDCNPCLNDGTCSQHDKIYTCACNRFHRGVMCEEEISGCELKPCFRGLCSSQNNLTIMCACEDGYSGVTCNEASVYTPVSIHIQEPFHLVYTNILNLETKRFIGGYVDKVNDQLIHLPTSPSARELLLRIDHDGNTVGDVVVVSGKTVVSPPHFNLTAMRLAIQVALRIFEVASLARTVIEKYSIIAINTPPERYVFTPVSFLLDEKFKLEFLDFTQNSSLLSIEVTEMWLNKELRTKSIDDFQFAYVTALRKVRNIVCVDSVVATLAYRAQFNPQLHQSDIKDAAIKVFSAGILGPYKVYYTGPKDVVVNVSDMGLAPSVAPQKYIFTHVIIRVEKEFQIEYILEDSTETNILTSIILLELTKSIKSVYNEFQFLDFEYARPVFGGITFVDLNVVSLFMHSNFDPNHIRKVLQEAVGATVGSGVLGKFVDPFAPDAYVIKDPELDKPLVDFFYAIATASVRLREAFSMAYTYRNSNKSLTLKSKAENELWKKFLNVNYPGMQFINGIQFINVTLFREEARSTTVVDINIGFLTTRGEFDATEAYLKLIEIIKGAIIDGELGGYPLNSADPKTLTVNAPILDAIPPRQEYAFSDATIQLQEPWNKVYNSQAHPDTKQLILNMEAVLNIAFNKLGNNQEAEVLEVKQQQKNISIIIRVAQLVSLDEYDIRTLEFQVLEAIQSMIEDSEFGGFKINPDATESVVLKQTKLSVLATGSKYTGISDDPKIPKIPDGKKSYSTPIGIAVGSVLFTAALVIVMVFSVRRNDIFKSKKNDAKSTTDTTFTETTKNSDGAGSSGSSSSSNGDD